MTPYEMIAQGIGIAAMIFNILSYQNKSHSRVIAFQLCGGFLFAINFFMLGATMGGILNVIGVIRALIFLNREKTKAEHPAWLIGFTLVFLSTYVMTFTVFAKEFNLYNAVIELLPVIGMTAGTQSFRCKEAKYIRRYGMISSPCWLIYNICNFAVGAIICEVFSICSIIIGMIRLDRKPRKDSAA